MVKRCFLCKRTFEKASSRSYHFGGELFPREATLRAKWFENLGIEPAYMRHIYLCSDHFSAENFFTHTGGRKALKKGSIPFKVEWKLEHDDFSEENCSLHESIVKREVSHPSEETLTAPLAEPLSETSSCTNTSFKCHSSSTCSNTETILCKCNETTTGTVTPPQKIPKFVLPRYVGDVDNCQSTTPRISEIKWELAKRQISKQQRKIRTLQQQNRRMRARILKLKNLLFGYQSEALSKNDRVKMDNIKS